MSVWGAAIGGLIGTFVLTTILRGASELRLTRIDLPFLLGTVVTAHRGRAKAVGYLLHFVAGLLFAMAYEIGFVALDRGGWVLGAGFGLIHGLFAGSALVNILLPIVHPRMGGPTSSIGSTALLEPPGFMMRNYGRSTPIVSLAAHVAYGAIVGASAAAAG
ncbi:MAG TPA: hypothetical protein VE669_06570 [Actinomycetota bacterium]|nr:hypothetical protein [Actinomycetota bacterium]